MMKLDLAVPEKVQLPENAAKSTWPIKMEVDYVRYYVPVPPPSPLPPPPPPAWPPSPHAPPPQVSPPPPSPPLPPPTCPPLVLPPPSPPPTPTWSPPHMKLHHATRLPPPSPPLHAHTPLALAGVSLLHSKTLTFFMLLFVLILFMLEVRKNRSTHGQSRGYAQVPRGPGSRSARPDSTVVETTRAFHSSRPDHGRGRTLPASSRSMRIHPLSTPEEGAASLTDSDDERYDIASTSRQRSAGRRIDEPSELPPSRKASDVGGEADLGESHEPLSETTVTDSRFMWDDDDKDGFSPGFAPSTRAPPFAPRFDDDDDAFSIAQPLARAQTAQGAGAHAAAAVQPVEAIVTPVQQRQSPEGELDDLSRRIEERRAARSSIIANLD